MSCYTKYLNQIKEQNASAEFESQITEPVSEVEIEHIENYMREHLHEAFSDEEQLNRLVNGYCKQQCIVYPDRANPLVKAVESVAWMMLSADAVFMTLTLEKLAKIVSVGGFFEEPLSSYVESCQFKYDIELQMIVATVATVLDTRVFAIVCGRKEIDKWFRQVALYTMYNAASVRDLNWSFEPCKLVGEWKNSVNEDGADVSELHLKFIFPDTTYWEYSFIA